MYTKLQKIIQIHDCVFHIEYLSIFDKLNYRFFLMNSFLLINVHDKSQQYVFVNMLNVEEFVLIRNCLIIGQPINRFVLSLINPFKYKGGSPLYHD